jgi:endonuclease-8
MEGPSLLLAAQQLKPFAKKKIKEVHGNTKIDKERLIGKTVLAIFAWGKHLVLQFDSFALRVHFLLYGSFEATVKDKKVTGDYPTKNRPVRLGLTFSNGHIEMYNCSLRFIESANAKEMYDDSVNIMSPDFDANQALETLSNYPERQIADVLLDQTVFAGVGNIIKNEVLFLCEVRPENKVKTLSSEKLEAVIRATQGYVWNFFEWRKRFELKKHYQIYRQSSCPKCHQKVVRKKTGENQRISFFCTNCQHLLP